MRSPSRDLGRPIDRLPLPLAPLLLALLAGACGTGSPPSTGVDAAAAGGTPTVEPVAGGVTEPGTGAAVGTDPDTAIDTGTDGEANPEPNVDPGDGEGADTGDGLPVASGGGDTSTPLPSTPLHCDAPTAAMQTRVLALVNAARAEARDCGGAGTFAATEPLGWDSRLEDAARTHSADMAATGNFDHTGTDGSSAGDRIKRAGYAYRTWSENIAAGQRTIEAAMDGWLASPGHCRNLMAPGVSDTALVCVTDDDAPYRHDWTQVFARPPTARR